MDDTGPFVFHRNYAISCVGGESPVSGGSDF